MAYIKEAQKRLAKYWDVTILDGVDTPHSVAEKIEKARNARYEEGEKIAIWKHWKNKVNL